MVGRTFPLATAEEQELVLDFLGRQGEERKRAVSGHLTMDKYIPYLKQLSFKARLLELASWAIANNDRKEVVPYLWKRVNEMESNYALQKGMLRESLRYHIRKLCSISQVGSYETFKAAVVEYVNYASAIRFDLETE